MSAKGLGGWVAGWLAGWYECQISYHDDVEKKLKMPVRLIVLGK